MPDEEVKAMEGFLRPLLVPQNPLTLLSYSTYQIWCGLIVFIED